MRELQSLRGVRGHEPDSILVLRGQRNYASRLPKIFQVVEKLADLSGLGDGFLSHPLMNSSTALSAREVRSRKVSHDQIHRGTPMKRCRQFVARLPETFQHRRPALNLGQHHCDGRRAGIARERLNAGT